MEWMVYNEDFNRHVIEPVNILRNYDDEIKKLKKKSKDYEDFSEQLRREMMWRYWSRCEYEVLMCIAKDGRVILKPWINPRNEEVSLDVTDDENFDWKSFAAECSKKYVSADNATKIDVYDQLDYRWDDFCRYCWSCG